MAKNTIPRGETSVIRHVFILDSGSTSGAGKTGLSSGSPGLVAYYLYAGGTATALTIETIATLGTYAAPTSNAHVRFREVSAANMPGWYELQFHNDWFSTANGRRTACLQMQGAAGMVPLNMEMDCVGAELQSATPLVKLGNVAHGGAAATLQMASSALGATTMVNAVGSGLTISGTTFGVEVEATNGVGIVVNATTTGIDVNGAVTGIEIGGASGAGVTISGVTVGIDIDASAGPAVDIDATGGNGDAIQLTRHGTGKAINAVGSVSIVNASGVGLAISGSTIGVDIDGGSDGGVTINTTDYHGVSIQTLGSSADGISVIGGSSGNALGLYGTAGIYVGGTTVFSGDLSAGNVQLTHLTVTTNSIAWNTAWEAGVRDAVGMASANLDTQLSGISNYVDCLPVSWVTVPTAVQIRQEMDASSTQLTAIVGYVDCLPAAWVTPLDAAGTRSALGLGSANLDTQLGDVPTVAEFNARSLPSADYATASSQTTITNYVDCLPVSWVTPLDAAGTRSALGMASANLDAQIATLATSANLAIVAGYLDTEITSILNGVNTLVSDWTNGGRLDNLLDQAAATLTEAGVRSAVGLASANLDTQLAGIVTYVDCLPVSWTTPLDAAATRAALGLASANLDGQLLTIVTDTNELQTDWKDGGRLDGLLDVAAGGGGGSGAYTVTITVTDGANPLPYARVRVTKSPDSESGTTDDNGQITFNLDAGSWVVGITRDAYSFSGATLVVSDNGSISYAMTRVSINPPAGPNKTTGWVVCLDNGGDPESGVTIYAEIVEWPGGSGYSPDRTRISFISDVNGLAQYDSFIRGATYKFKRGRERYWGEAVEAPDAVSWELPSILGLP